MLSQVQFPEVYETEHGSARVSPTGYVSNVHIKDEARGQGRGTELMSKITSDADRMGSSLTLHARPDLHPWYQRLGFNVEGEDVFGPRLKREPG